MQKTKNWFAFCLVIAQALWTLAGDEPDSKEGAGTVLELVFVIFRHGERLPERNEGFPMDKYKIEDFYPLTYGDVTKEGMRRQYHLGKKLRRRYDSFLGPLYSSEKVKISTTNWDRTKVAALATMAGLFAPDPAQMWDPNLPWLPIPYHSKPNDSDFLLQRPEWYCPRYTTELKQVLDSDPVKNLTGKYQMVFDYVTENSGRNMFDYHEMFRIYQNIHAKRALNLSIPHWALNIYPEPLQTIASYQCVFENYNNILKRLNGGRILQKIIHLSQEKIWNGTTKKMYLYSAHDNNIVNILAVLGLYQQHIPPYCGTVILELHRELVAGNRYGFKVFYDNDTYAETSSSLTVPGCSQFCGLDQFLELTKELVPVNYTAECQSDKNLD